MSQKQARLISVHIPKTGGTTFTNILQQRFSGDLVLDYGQPVDAVASLIAPKKEFCIHGHFKAGKHAALENKTLITWLREPLDRIISHYNFWRTHRYPFNQFWLEFHYNEMSFVEFALDRRLRNEQSMYLDGVPIADYEYVGITEHFQQSLDLFASRYGIELPEEIPHSRDSGRLPQAIKASDIDKADLNKIRAFHHLDYAVYFEALSQFSKDYQETLGKSLTAPTPRKVGEKLEVRNAAQGLSRLDRADVPFLVGSYIYGENWPINMWDSFKRRTFEDYVLAAKADGYNTLFLLIPSGLEIIKRKAPEKYKIFWDDLQFSVDCIKKHGLAYGFRVAYSWDGYDFFINRGRHVFSILAGGAERTNYNAILKDLWD
ncbi:MAG: sulfotransferase family 2 domain-containing protein, partial [Pseudomonadota bacterium]